MTTQTKSSTAATDEIAETVTGYQHDALDRMEKVGSAVLEGMTRWNAEFSRFIADRIEEDVRTQKEMMQCQTLKELQSVQTRFFSTAIEQYTEETRRLMSLGRGMVSARGNRA